MKKLLFSLIAVSLISCQAPKEKQSEQSSEPTVIGYEFNDKGEKLNIIAGDAAITFPPSWRPLSLMKSLMRPPASLTINSAAKQSQEFICFSI